MTGLQQIVNSEPADLPEIMRLYGLATAYMKERSLVHWPEFDPAMVAAEIGNRHQWKGLIEGMVAVIWATTFSDPQIWGDRNADPAVYIHRIAVAPAFRGRKFVPEILQWAKAFAIANSKRLVRLDTVGNNTKLIEVYTSAGFRFLGLHTLADASALPAHYSEGPTALFEVEV